jgi:hypothetical protein
MLSHRFYKVGFYTSVTILSAVALAAIAAIVVPGIVAYILNISGKGSPNMPVGVGGGAMTIRGDGSDGTGKDSSDGTPCFILKRGLLHTFGRTEIEMDGVTKGQTVPLNTKGTTVRRLLNSSWTMDMFNRSRGGSGAAATAWIELDPTQKCVQNDKLNDGVTVKVLGQKSGAYNYGYLTLTPLDEDGSVRMRYKSNDDNCTKTPDPTGDEDMCEHMSKITITTGGQTSPYNCTSGECSIGIEE